VGGERRREKSLRNGVHRADAVVREAVSPDRDGVHLRGRGLLVGSRLGELLDLVPHRGALVDALLGDLRRSRSRTDDAGEG
jgi:hypothetical protein